LTPIINNLKQLKRFHFLSKQEKKISAIPKDKPQSPILFTIIAFIAALLA